MLLHMCFMVEDYHNILCVLYKSDYDSHKSIVSTILNILSVMEHKLISVD